MPSRLFLYYNERAARGVECADCGSTPRTGMKVMAKFGDCPEELWPYKVKMFAAKPPRFCYAKARKYKAVKYHRIPRELEKFKGCLASGYPFVFGFTVHESFQSFDKGSVRYIGRIRMPTRGGKVEGGHAVMAVGYDDEERILVRNSSGKDWETGGYFTMPYKYLLDYGLSADLWAIRVLS